MWSRLFSCRHLCPRLVAHYLSLWFIYELISGRIHDFNSIHVSSSGPNQLNDSSLLSILIGILNYWPHILTVPSSESVMQFHVVEDGLPALAVTISFPFGCISNAVIAFL